MLSREFLQIDIVEERDKFIIFVDVPGVLKEDIDVVADEDKVNITVVRRPLNLDSGRFLVLERISGVFKRSIKLPEKIDPSGANGFLENGVLTLVLPKSKEKYYIDDVCGFKIRLL